MDSTLESSYILFCGLALIANIIVSTRMMKKDSSYSNGTIIKCLIIENIGIVLGAKLLDIISNYGIYLDWIDKHLYIKIFLSGYSFLGGMYGAFISIIIYSMISNNDLQKLCEILIPNLLLVYAISKIGCFITGCCYGITVNRIRIPIQLIESIVYFIIFLILTIKIKDGYKKLYLFCLLFSICRFSLEFLRENQNDEIVSLPQLLCIALLITGIIMKQKRK